MNNKIEKIITFIVLLWLVYGIFNLDSSDLWSIEKNWFPFLGFLVFIIYLIYSIQKAAKNNPR
ncbi:hypothetical protein [Myroides indicus]|uniref:Uncharacterized protein n=1 Tax=Myroides indicus TaxID=1323422 RepID=A0A4R7F4Q8_9FLAO|nr:hypothetical protein [Myroides indicus]TDS65037.1 hypothetical protein C8P70_10357 [Myroides indicus]